MKQRERELNSFYDFHQFYHHSTINHTFHITDREIVLRYELPHIIRDISVPKVIFYEDIYTVAANTETYNKFVLSQHEAIRMDLAAIS